MRSAADSSPFILSPAWPLRALLRTSVVLAVAGALAACGGDGGSAGGTAGASGASAKPEAAAGTATVDDTSAKKDDGEVRYAP